MRQQPVRLPLAHDKDNLLLPGRQRRWRHRQVQGNKGSHDRLQLRRLRDRLNLLLLLVGQQGCELTLKALYRLRHLLLKGVNLQEQTANDGRMGAGLAKQNVQLSLSCGYLLLQPLQAWLELAKQACELRRLRFCKTQERSYHRGRQALIRYFRREHLDFGRPGLRQNETEQRQQYRRTKCFHCDSSHSASKTPPGSALFTEGRTESSARLTVTYRRCTGQKGAVQMFAQRETRFRTECR